MCFVCGMCGVRSCCIRVHLMCVCLYLRICHCVRVYACVARGCYCVSTVESARVCVFRVLCVSVSAESVRANTPQCVQETLKNIHAEKHTESDAHLDLMR